MRCPRLNELPPPPSGKTGWPWTEESLRLPSQMSDGRLWPRITVVTPSFNQEKFIEETIRSILLQGYPNLEYFVIDGASTDKSVDIIKKYSPWLEHWVSEPDGGQTDAIGHGLRWGSGLFATWINSDDMLCRNALFEHASRFGFSKDVVYVGNCLYINETGKPLSTHRARVHSFEDLVRIRQVWRTRGHIVQPEVLFPLELTMTIGGLNIDNQRTMDYELWGKLFLAGAKFQYTDIPFAMFRKHQNQKTRDRFRTTESLIDTAVRMISAVECFPKETQDELLKDLQEYKKDYWRNTGPLARLGLPPQIVMPLRDLKLKYQRRIRKFLKSGSAREAI